MKAPEFPQNLRWFNLHGAPELRMKDLRAAKVVLIDFWTYSCVNCIRTLPYLKKWHEKYAKLGLVVVGVHTPEFDFEKNVENVARAIKEFGVEYPVVMDSDYQVWSLYSNNVWPRKFLINKNGQAIYDHAGEGGYAETEEAIQKALLEINPKLKLPAVESDPSTALGAGKVCLPATPETYLGSMRGRTGRIWNFFGKWKMHTEFIEHERKTEKFEDFIALNFEAAEVNLVMEASGGEPTKVLIELDDKPLCEIEVRSAKMYNLLNEKKLVRGQLKIFSKDAGFRAYVFTFGGCPIPAQT